MSYADFNWEVISHDYVSPYHRNLMWTHSFSRHPRYLGIASARAGIVSRNNDIEYVVDNATWATAYRELTARVIADSRNLEQLIERLVVKGERLNAWTEQNIFLRDLGDLPGYELISLLRTAIDMEEDVNAYGTALAIPDYRNFSFIDGHLKKFLTSKAGAEKVQELYSLFTEPEYMTFAQVQEEELLALMGAFWDDVELLEDIRTKNPEEVKAAHGKFWSALSEHARKHAWVYYGNMGPAFSEADFLALIKDHIGKGVDPRAEAGRREQKRADIVARKAAALREFAPEGLDAFILRIAGRVVWAKPR